MLPLRTVIPKAKETFKPVRLPYSTLTDSDSEEDEVPCDFLKPTEEEKAVAKSFLQCEKAIKPGRVAGGVHYINPKTEESVQLLGLNSSHCCVYLQVYRRGGDAHGSIALAKDDKPFLKIDIKTTASYQGRIVKEGDEAYSTAPRETSVEVSLEARKTVQVPKEAVNLGQHRYCCFKIRRARNAAKVYVNNVEVARFEGTWMELLEPHKLLVSGTVIVKSVHVPTSALPRTLHSLVGGGMDVGDRIVIFGDIEPQGDGEPQPIVTLGGVRLFADKEEKSQGVRIVLQRYRKSLVAYKNTQPVFTSKDGEKVNTEGDLQFGERFLPTGVWISRLGKP